MTIEHPNFGTLTDDRIIIFDTTLRDGEQSPGFSMNLQEKLRMAEALAELGVDVMEAGFPIASPGDFESVKSIAETIKGPVIARPRPRRPRRHHARRRGRARGRAQAHPHLPQHPPLHMKYKLRMEPEAVLQRAVDSVTLARAIHRRRGVVRRGWQPHGGRFPVPLRRGRDQGRGHHDQHPGHGRLRPARGYASHLHACCASACRAPTGVISVHAQPQRPGPGRRQHPRRRRRRRAADRMHDQRHRRARRQRGAGRSGDGASAPGHDAVPAKPAIVTENILKRLETALRHHRLRRAAEQGDRRPQRLRP